MNNKVAEINKLTEYIAFVCEVKDLRFFQDEKYLRPELLFRGHADKCYELCPSIGRIKAPILQRERNLIETAKNKLPNIFQDKLQPIDLLALLQHFGIPTRLLDVTENPLVALFFACNGSGTELNKDGEILIFRNNDYDIANYPIINGIADTYRFANSSDVSLSTFYSRVMEQDYFKEQKWEHTNTSQKPHYGEQWIERVCKDILFVHTKEISERQKIQQGRYILFPNNICKYANGDKPFFESKISPICKQHESIIGRCIIASERKKDILDELSIFGISEEILFRDSPDIVCKKIAAQYKWY